MRPERVKNESGGFHNLKEFWNARGQLFEFSHLRYLVGGWRNSEDKVSWYLFPGDPRQTEMETPVFK
jgi:hypothetical protein